MDGLYQTKPDDAPTVRAANAVLANASPKGRLGRLLPFLGPAFIACVAYIDPGNFATNIQAGAQFGYALLWVVVASNLMALLVQALSAKLGIATGANLAELCQKGIITLEEATNHAQDQQLLTQFLNRR